MSATGFTLFETALGRCGMAWSDDGIAAVQLPGRTVGATRGRMRRVTAGAPETAPSAAADRAMRILRDHLAGGETELRSIALDMAEVPAADRPLYELLRATEPGSRVTYGELARRLGRPATPRSVGAALGRNPFAVVVPCHRVVAADGRLGGFSAPGGVAVKLRLLALELGAGPWDDGRPNLWRVAEEAPGPTLPA